MSLDLLEQPLDPFADRHLGPSPAERGEMLDFLGLDSLETLVDAVVPRSIRSDRPLAIGAGDEEHRLLADLGEIAAGNKLYRSYLGMGYHGSIMPAVILRNVLENPGWYTQYTPYQAEIAQGRLEALVNFQTLVCELTALPIANASLLDEATAAAEAMAVCWARTKRKRNVFLVDELAHPQILGVVQTRARPLGIEVRLGDPLAWEPGEEVFGALAQYPATDGRVRDLSGLADALHRVGARLVVAADPLALLLLRPPGDFGADVAVGSTQRFGLPPGGGGPHAGYLACTQELERAVPGRIAGVSKDVHGAPAYRLALQTREQHIRREKATSNICTAQVLPAVLASMYAVYHGPEGLRRIAGRVRQATEALGRALSRIGAAPTHAPVFDTVRLDLDENRADRVVAAAAEHRINLRRLGRGAVGISLDETVGVPELEELLVALATGLEAPVPALSELVAEDLAPYPAELARGDELLPQAVFHHNRSEHEMLRDLHRLQERDLSLTHSMIPLGSCTMKLNATAEMIPVTWPEFAQIHPFAPADQQQGYARVVADLERWLADITGLGAVSLQPNAGSQGELTGLLVIRAYHEARGDAGRDVCLIPTSAHDTNPASAVMAGLRVVAVACDAEGNIDLADLGAKAEEHADRLAALMITYPSTHGVFEESVREVCETVHRHGGQVYLDGANMNAQVGLCRPGEFGADVCHLNLHKTFCIPHGGGGPGVGPICAADHLAPFLPGHPVMAVGGKNAIGPVSAAPWGSPQILPISWAYIRMMGSAGLERASQTAILNANYMAKRLASDYPILYVGRQGFVAHEFILDLRDFKKSAGITVDDVAKRLMDYGFHAPTMSWPVAGTMMVEPTESESKAELDRFCDAMIAIREEIREIERCDADRENNLLKNAPHTAAAVAADNWPHPYSRERAAYPAPWMRERKFWPPVGRIDNVWGDRHLICTCDPVEAFAE